MRIVALSDTHNRHDSVVVPEGDCVVHAGDITSLGTLEELQSFAGWWRGLPHRHKVVIAGNHDFCFERQDERALARQLFDESHYLEDEAVTLEGRTFYGSPWQPWFFDWAFNLPRGPELARVWSKIPANTDVLVTHGPPRSILDTTASGEDVGCDDLLDRVREVGPRLHLFGHIHEAHGVRQVGPTWFANVCICTLEYAPLNRPMVFEI